MLELGTRATAVEQSRNTPDHNAAVLGKTLSTILFGFHFKHKYQFNGYMIGFPSPEWIGMFGQNTNHRYGARSDLSRNTGIKTTKYMKFWTHFHLLM